MEGRSKVTWMEVLGKTWRSMGEHEVVLNWST